MNFVKIRLVNYCDKTKYLVIGISKILLVFVGFFLSLRVEFKKNRKMSTIHWHTKIFNELTVEELYDILKLRTDIFVVEQNCAYPELDDKDKKCLHIYATVKGKVVASSRIVPPGLSYPQISIGRVAVHPDYRKGGTGRALMQHSIEKIAEEFGEQDIQIGAQCYLRGFYESLGFESASDDYVEDGIPHVDMIRKAKKYWNKL